MIYNDPSKRHDFVLLFDVTNGNPNGDPDAGNSPRIDPETGHGIVTDVALKRKVRNFVALDAEVPIFIQSEHSLNSLIVQAFRDTGVEPPEAEVDDGLVAWFAENAPEGFSLEEGNKVIYGGDAVKVADIRTALLAALDSDDKDSAALRKGLGEVAKKLAAAAKRGISTAERANARQRLCERYFDIRMFGAVLGTGLNAGQVRGPMQLTFARSVDPIDTQELSITRQARTTSLRMETGSTEMGRKHVVPYGLYRAHGFFSPKLAAQTGVSEEDLALFWRALQNLFVYDRSAARPEMDVRGLYVFSHESPLGNAPAHQLFERVRAVKKSNVTAPRSFADYSVEVDAANLPEGITLTEIVS